MTRRRSSAPWAAVACLALVLAGCTPTKPLVDDPFTDVIEGATGTVPLPPDARYEPADSRPPINTMEGESEGTLAPDDKTPEERVPSIVARGRIIIGVDQSLNRLGFRDTTTGELSGFEVALAQEIARDIFGDPDAVEFRYVDSTERVGALREDRVDAVVRTMSVTTARERAVDFSAPYLTARAGLLVPAESGIDHEDDLDGRRVCVAADSTPEEIARQKAPGATLLLVRGWSDCLVALQQYQVDAVLSDDTILAGINDQDPSLAIVRRGLSMEQYAVGVAQGDDGLVRQINSTLERMRSDGTWRQLYLEWLGAFLPEGTQPYPSYRAEPEDDAAPEGGENR